jgi:secondary thiamine-phosphate synthase enzyme
MKHTITVASSAREELIDITLEVKACVKSCGIRDGLVALYAQGATAAIMIQENWDASVRTDVIHLLQKLIPRGVWLHDQQDGNGDSHLKAGLIGPSETIPIIGGELGLSSWQNIFLCEFDGPRNQRGNLYPPGRLVPGNYSVIVSGKEFQTGTTVPESSTHS